MFREQGILRRFHVSPVTASDMLASSVVANFVLTLPTLIVELLFARLLFHVSSFGNLATVFILVLLGTMSFASLGLVVASVTNTMQETQVINQLIWLPLIFLSGATVPLVDLPHMVQRVGLFLPATYLVTELQDAIYWGASPRNGDVLIALGSLIVWACLTFFLSAQLFRWEPEAKIPNRAKLYVAATALPFILLGFWENHSSHTITKAQAMYQSLNAPASPSPDDHPHPDH
jgi:ABC-2 type transport system permease protein